MSDYDNIRVEIDDRIATVTFDRPEVMNALNEATTADLGRALDALERNDDVGVLVLTGAGEKAFVAGADIKELDTYGAVEAQAAARTGQRILDRLEQFPKPVIAAINGYALGGGCEVALACHVRIMADTAKIGLPEIGLGVIPGHGGTQRLPRLIGKGRALELICTGRHVAAEEAERLGLVGRVVPADELEATVRELAAELAAKPPIALRYALEAVHQGVQGTLAEGQAIEADLFGLCFATEDQSEGMSAFLEKRKPEWKGR